MKIKNRTKEIFDWDTEDDLYGLIYPDNGSHPEFTAEFPGVILEEDTLDLVATV